MTWARWKNHYRWLLAKKVTWLSEVQQARKGKGRSAHEGKNLVWQVGRSNLGKQEQIETLGRKLAFLPPTKSPAQIEPYKCSNTLGTQQNRWGKGATLDLWGIIGCLLSLPWNPDESNLKPAKNEEREKRKVSIDWIEPQTPWIWSKRGRMHHLLAPVGSRQAGRGRRGSERAQSGEAEGECEGEHRERGGDGEDYKVEEWRERGGGNPSFPRAPPCPTCIWRANFFGRWTLALVPREPSRQETESIFFSQQPGSGERVARPGPCPKPHTSIQTMENYILGVRPRQIQETKRALYVFRWRPILNLDLLIGLTHLKDIYGLSRLLYLLM